MSGMSKINREEVLAYSLSFVVFWFGINEVLTPGGWRGMVPVFLGGFVPKYLVLAHGTVLILCGLGMLFNFYRRVAAIVLCLLLIEIVVSLLMMGGLSAVAVRDIGLLGMAFALTLKN